MTNTGMLREVLFMTIRQPNDNNYNNNAAVLQYRDPVKRLINPIMHHMLAERIGSH